VTDELLEVGKLNVAWAREQVPSVANIDGCEEKMSYSPDSCTQNRIESMETEVTFFRKDIKEMHNKMKGLRQKLNSLNVPATPEEREARIQATRERIGLTQQEIEQRQGERGQPERTDVNVRDNDVEGLIGVLAHMVRLRPGPHALALRVAIASACDGMLSAVRL
jgi:hypothetical protein